MYYIIILVYFTIAMVVQSLLHKNDEMRSSDIFIFSYLWLFFLVVSTLIIAGLGIYALLSYKQ